MMIYQGADKFEVAYREFTMRTKFFVYGTLKVGGFFSKKFDKKRLSVKKATDKGTMYNITNSYPAVVFDGKYDISGEIHEYADEKEVIKLFDLIEGFIKKIILITIYNRKTITEDSE